eukprot:TRINITY_DN1955_c0_g2_i2.p1 TRINITY_DN1955_c0_g2~~TRINITY_DN1955_c0_g2_i2.p1  ORF type:complete len:383 (-),score=64.84 TRINITY_DN1955_c0_g2_i2:119-1267(-)
MHLLVASILLIDKETMSFTTFPFLPQPTKRAPTFLIQTIPAMVFDFYLMEFKSKQLIATQFFNLISSPEPINKPLCFFCTTMVHTEETRQLEDLQTEQETYQRVINQFETEQANDLSLEDEILQLEEEEKKLMRELKLLQEEKKSLATEKENLVKKTKEVETMEQSYWKEMAELESHLRWFTEEREANRSKIEFSKEQLDWLKRTNVYNDTFYISQEGQFGIINDFRLGRLPKQPVEWSEINAAWGQACLLLWCMAHKLKYKFTKYRVIPMGSTSMIEQVSDKTVYELFGSDEFSFSFGRLFWYRRFDAGMTAFLSCLKELCEYAKSVDPSLFVPFPIADGKISDHNIRIQFGNEETWTKALKCVLTNMKWLMAWISRTVIQ